MITINVKTLWLDKVAIRDKFVKEAQSKGEGITITHGDAKMVIPNTEIKYAIAGRSEKPFQDKFSLDRHYLYYFEWKPNCHQFSMF